MRIIAILLFSIFIQFTSYGQTTHQKTTTNKTIIVYGSPDCHHCIDTKKFLTDNNINFVFCDIDHDKTAVQEMLSKLKAAKISTSNLGIPVIDKYGEIFQNKGNFDDFLKKIKE
jgi:glutaredoxin